MHVCGNTRNGDAGGGRPEQRKNKKLTGPHSTAAQVAAWTRHASGKPHSSAHANRRSVDDSADGRMW